MEVHQGAKAATLGSLGAAEESARPEDRGPGRLHHLTAPSPDFFPRVSLRGAEPRVGNSAIISSRHIFPALPEV